MNKQTEALKLALEALETIRQPLRINTSLDAYDVGRAIIALREAMAERPAQQQEPVACARVAESLWQQFQDTKDAHERNSLEPFMLGRFGFDQSTIQQSRRIADAIRARGQA